MLPIHIMVLVWVAVGLCVCAAGCVMRWVWCVCAVCERCVCCDHGMCRVCVMCVCEM